MATSKRARKTPLLVDEGMWTLDNVPASQLQKHYGFVPDDRWLKSARLAAVRFNDGGSGSFVSANGLVLTNHHVALGQLQKLSTEKNNYVEHGFFARSAKQELRCPDLELNRLVSMVNVSARVHAALSSAKSAKRQHEALRATIADIEHEYHERTQHRCDVVELYQGGEYWLYEYEKFTDIRLVMAPESGAAFFGGDPDNFSYPRYCLDFAFFRVYQDDQPVSPKHYFRFQPKGAKEGELLFVLGHPGSTERLMTVEQLRYQRDIALPKRLELIAGRLAAIADYAGDDKEKQRRAMGYRFSLENAQKVMGGEHERLRDAELFAKKEDAEASLLDATRSKQALARDTKKAIRKIASLQQSIEARHLELSYRRLNAHRAVSFAETLVRHATEITKPNAKRYEEFRDSGLASLRHRLLSPAPIYLDLEQAMLAHALAESLDKLGPKDPFVQAALDGKTPKRAAAAAFAKTKLDDPEARKALLDGGTSAIEASNDSLIALARRVDAVTREVRDWYQNHIEGPLRAAGDQIAKARFSIFGKDLYPDATFTLRLSYGCALGYSWNKTLVPHKTTFYGLFDRAASFDHAPPYELPKRVKRARNSIRLDTPINFVSTHDIIGGNSGSPVINTKRQLVGLIFDGNAQSFAAGYLYEREAGRAVSVDVRGILEALRSIYDVKPLLTELTGR